MNETVRLLIQSFGFLGCIRHVMYSHVRLSPTLHNIYLPLMRKGFSCTNPRIFKAKVNIGHGQGFMHAHAQKYACLWINIMKIHEQTILCMISHALSKSSQTPSKLSFYACLCIHSMYAYTLAIQGVMTSFLVHEIVMHLHQS